MPKSTSIYVCQQCGFRSSQFLGRCPECGTWNSLVEEQVNVPKVSGSKKTRNSADIVNLTDINQEDYQRLSTGLEEFDRVLGGGVVNGEVVLVAGDPGIGKSTLLSQLALNVPNTLYVAGEESARQIKIRVDRIKPGANLKILNEINVDSIVAAIASTKPG